MMRMTDSFGRTLRQAPAGHDPSTAYAVRASLVRIVEERLVFLPLGFRVANNIAEELLRENDAVNVVGLPDNFSLDAWRMLLDDEIQSYRQLPLRLFSRRLDHFSDHHRGLASPEQVHGLQWHYAATSEGSLTELREQWLQRNERRLDSLGLPLQRLARGGRTVGWAYQCAFGPEVLLSCTSCSYMASLATARFKRSGFAQEDPQPLEIIPTPDADTIENLAAFLDIPTTKTLKVVFLRGDDGTVVLALIRGDLEISVEKLEGLINRGSLVPASRAEIEGIGAVPGYASPIGLQVRERSENEGVLVVADLSIEHGSNFVSGANKPGFHFVGVNYPRDFEVTSIADIAMPKAGDPCPKCGEPLESRAGIRIGDWEGYGDAFHFSDEGGNLSQGCLGIGTLYLEPILAALIDVYHRDGFTSWPGRLAPYDVYLVDLRSPHEANEVLEGLRAQGLSVLLDDRDVSPGVKFTDADLIGCLMRITVSKRSLERGGVELVCPAGQTEAIYPISAVALEAATLKNKIM
jgi:prolyl-tRNA synthetase